MTVKQFFQLVRDLVQAKFDRGDEELTKRLWPDAADRDIDLDRVINLMYTCYFLKTIMK